MITLIIRCLNAFTHPGKKFRTWVFANRSSQCEHNIVARVVAMLIAHVVVVLVAHVLGVLVASVVTVLVLAHVVAMLAVH